MAELTSLSKHDAYDSLTFHPEYGSSWMDYANASESSYCPLPPRNNLRSYKIDYRLSPRKRCYLSFFPPKSSIILKVLGRKKPFRT